MTRPVLPPLLERYVERAIDQVSPEAAGTLLHQEGHMRLGPDRDWMPFSAEQTIEAKRTGFVWHARFRMAPLVTGVVEDAFEEGHGRLDAKLWGLIPVAHGRGPEVDRGEAERYLSELVWCPMAIRDNPELHFESRGNNCVRAWVYDEETYVDLFFDGDGDISGARTLTRSRGDERQPWEGRFAEYRQFGPIRAPAYGEVWWEAPDGDFLYWKGRVTELALR
jgi:hypothetical protein